MLAGDDQACYVCDIGHENRVHFTGDVCEHIVVDGPGICAGSRDDHSGTVFLRQVSNLVVIDPMIVCANRIGDHMIYHSREVFRMPPWIDVHRPEDPFPNTCPLVS